MGGLSVEVKLCRGDCSLVVSSEKFASPFTLAVEQTCASVEHYNFDHFVKVKPPSIEISLVHPLIRAATRISYVSKFL